MIGVVTEMTPLVAPWGMVVTIVAEFAEAIIASLPLTLTVLLLAIGSKFCPVIVTVIPTGPLVGVKLVTTDETSTIKFVALVAVPAEPAMTIFPVVAPLGTTAVIVVALLIVKIAALPLSVTDCTLIKSVPVMVTVVPTVPLVGMKLMIVGGGGITVTWLAALAPLSETVMVVDPEATAVTVTGTLVCPDVNETDAGTVATAGFALLTVSEPAAVGAGASMAVSVPVAPALRLSGFGVRAVGCEPALVSSTVSVMKLPGALVRRISSVFEACGVMVRSMTATFCPKSLGPRICVPFSVTVADEIRLVPLALPLTTWRV